MHVYMHQNGRESCALHPMFLETTWICDPPFMYTHTHTHTHLYTYISTCWIWNPIPHGHKAKALTIKPNYGLVLKMVNKLISHVWFKHLWKLKTLTHGFSFTYFVQIKQIKTCSLFFSKIYAIEQLNSIQLQIS